MCPRLEMLDVMDVCAADESETSLLKLSEMEDGGWKLRVSGGEVERGWHRCS